MDVISKNIGHASVAITNDISAHLTHEVMEDAAQKTVGRLFGGIEVYIETLKADYSIIERCINSFFVWLWWRFRHSFRGHIR